MYFDTHREERHDRFFRDAFVSYEDVYFSERADERGPDGADLPVIGDHNLLPCLTHHGAMNSGLVRIVGS